MTTIQQYVSTLYVKQDVVAAKLGVDLSRSSKSDRVMNRCTLILVAVLTKAIVDKGLATDAEMLALLDSAGSVAWDDLPVDPPPAANQ
jgi:hypothetical protein